MTPRQHSTNTRVLAAPPGVPIEVCVPLPVTDLEIDGVANVASFWYPDRNELDKLKQGHPVCITIEGTTHPPLRVGVALSKI